MKRLKTLKGTPIRRSRWGVGKEMGTKIYFHRDYIQDLIEAGCIDEGKMKHALEVAQEYGFEFRCVMVDKLKDTYRFDSAPDFDTAREPIPGDSLSVTYRQGKAIVKTSHCEQIWHHKWLWVSDDYNGFDVDESYRWSETWLKSITHPSGNKRIWDAALVENGLPIEA